MQPGIEPLTFCLVGDLLFLLSHINNSNDNNNNDDYYNNDNNDNNISTDAISPIAYI